MNDRFEPIAREWDGAEARYPAHFDRSAARKTWLAFKLLWLPGATVLGLIYVGWLFVSRYD